MTEHNNEQRATWGDDGFAETSGYTIAYIADPETAEYRGQSDVWVSEGTGLPAGAYHDGPPASSEGKAIVRQATGWQPVTDLRGVVVYDKSTGHPVIVNAIGDLLEKYTLLEPSSPYDKWTSDGWVKDKVSEQQATLAPAKAEQSTRLYTANQQVAIIKPAVDGGYAKPEHIKLLADWQRYCYELTLVPEQADWPYKPQWPEPPATVI